MADLKLQSNWKKSDKVYQSICYGDLEVVGDRSVKNTYRRFKRIGLYEALKSHHSVLDIGCNLGALCLEACKIGCSRVVGIDKSVIIDDAELIKKKTAASVEYYKIDLSHCDLADLYGLVSGDFDHVFALAVMMYIPQSRFWKIIRHYAQKTFWFETNHRPKDKKIRRLFGENLPSHSIRGKWENKEADDKGRHRRIVYRLERR